MTRELAAVQRRLGPTPRAVDRALASAFTMPPRSLGPGDPLTAQWDAVEHLLAHGEVAMGRFYLANNVLFEPGPQSGAPAGVVYSFDPLVAASPGVLATCGARLVALREGTEDPPTDPWTRRVAGVVANDYLRSFAVRLPPGLTQGHVVWQSTVFVVRDHLPVPFLARMDVPVLALREHDGVHDACMVVPSALWADSWRARWLDAAEG